MLPPIASRGPLLNDNWQMVPELGNTVAAGTSRAVSRQAIGALCLQHDMWFVVDAIQQPDAVPLDVRKTPVNILACSGHEWLNSQSDIDRLLAAIAEMLRSV